MGSWSAIRNVIMPLGLMLLAGGGLGWSLNLLHPDAIPWVEDWSNYVESKAGDAHITVIPLGLALSYYEAGEHQFIDARKSGAYDVGHVPGAISIPYEGLDEQFDAIEQAMASDRALIVYCKNRECDDALLLAIELRELGLSNLLYYVDGFDLWEASGCPVTIE